MKAILLSMSSPGIITRSGMFITFGSALELRLEGQLQLF
jgi:hypothetical protein